MTTTMKITRKGQVTIPKQIRDLLKTNIVSFHVVKGEVIVSPVHDAAGSLARYARNVNADRPFKMIKEQAWEEAVREKNSRKSS